MVPAYNAAAMSAQIATMPMTSVFRKHHVIRNPNRVPCIPHVREIKGSSG